MGVLAAIQSGDIEALRSALAANPAEANVRDANGVPAVLAALYNRRPDFVQALLDAGAEVDLFSASALGRIDDAVRLLNGTPDLINRRSADGWTPLHLASFFGHPDLARLLLERGADPLARSENAMANLPIHAATAARQAEIVAMLLEAGTPVNATQRGGYTPLHSAAQNNDRATMEVLLKHGADMNLASDDGKTSADLLPKL